MARRRTVASPIPPPPPVTTATLPSRRRQTGRDPGPVGTTALLLCSAAGYGRSWSASPGITPCRFHERAEQAQVSPVLLGVPLDADRKPPALDFDRLNRAVVSEADGLQALPEPVHGLVVMAPTLSLGAENRADGAGGLQYDPVGAGVTENRPMVIVADYLGEVLMKGAAEADVQQLQAAADGKQGQARSQRGAAEGKFPFVSLVSWRVRLIMGDRAVEAWAHIRPTDEDQAVDSGQRRCDPRRPRR
jgi:hypothetical protein